MVELLWDSNYKEQDGGHKWVAVSSNSYVYLEAVEKPETKVRDLLKMRVPEDLAYQTGNTRRGYWFVTHTVAYNMAMTKERLVCAVI